METLSTEKQIENLATELGVTLQCSAPSAGVDKPRDKEAKPWPHIAYTVTLSRNGREIYSGPYKLGVGHIKIKAPQHFEGQSPKFDLAVYNALRNNPHATLKDPMEHANFAAICAKAQKVTPSLPSVLHSLLMDGSAHFDAPSFTEWCSEYGYDDSISARETWEACCEVGRKLARAFSYSEIEQLREAVSNY